MCFNFLTFNFFSFVFCLFFVFFFVQVDGMELTFTIWDADNDGMDQYLGHYTFVKQELKNLLQTKQNLSQKAMQKLGKLGKKQSKKKVKSKKKGKPGTNNNNPLFKCVKIENLRTYHRMFGSLLSPKPPNMSFKS